MVKLKVQFLSSPPIDFEWNKESLKETIEKLLAKFNFHGGASDFVLQNDATKQTLTEQDFESASSQLSSGTLLVLKPSASLVTKYLQELANPKSVPARRVIFELRSHLQDEDFAKAFLSPPRSGLQLIVRFMEEAQGSSLAYGLAALTEALKYSFAADMAQQLLTPDFIVKRLFSVYLNSNNLNVRKGALALAALLANRPQWGFRVIDTAIRQSQINDNPPYHNIVDQLASTDVTVQVLTLQLINNLLLSLVKHSGVEKDKDLPAALQMLDTLESLGIFKLLRRIVKDLQDENLKRQLYIFQCLRLKKYQARKEESYDKTNTVHEETLLKFWATVFPETPLKDRISDQWKKMGFQGTDPATDFRGMGMLGLLNLLYFAETHTQLFRKLLQLQQQRQQLAMAREYPVAVTGINITQMLYDLFGVGKPIVLDPQQPPGNVFKVLFDSPTAFEEVYCLAFQLLDRTWEEMNANYMDFPKVIATVRSQIETVLESQPLSVEAMARLLLSGGSVTITGGGAMGGGSSGVEAAGRDGGGNDGVSNKAPGTTGLPGASSSTGSGAVAAPVVSVFNAQVFQDDSSEPAHLRAVKANLRKELVLLFTQHKIGLLMEGQAFMTPSGYKSTKAAKSGDEVTKAPSGTAVAFLFVRLHQSQNELLYGPVTSLADKPRTLPNKVAKTDIVTVRSGAPAAQSGKAKKLDADAMSRLMCITLKDGTNLELIAATRAELADWADGLRLLLSQQLEEKESYAELQKLIDIELQVRLIDLTGITLPESQPPIPPPPLSFDFVTALPAAGQSSLSTSAVSVVPNSPTPPSPSDSHGVSFLSAPSTPMQSTFGTTVTTATLPPSNPKVPPTVTVPKVGVGVPPPLSPHSTAAPPITVSPSAVGVPAANSTYPMNSLYNVSASASRSLSTPPSTAMAPRPTPSSSPGAALVSSSPLMNMNRPSPPPQSTGPSPSRPYVLANSTRQ
jgi:hypothetical protein